jgi:hypothetical protein
LSSNESFVYCWTDTKTNMLYVGSHKGSLDDGYVSSSKYFLAEYKTRKEDFTRTIIAMGSDKDIRNLETTILQNLNASRDALFYNRHNKNCGFTFADIVKDEKFCKNLSIIQSEKARRGEHNMQRPEQRLRASKRFSGENNPMFGCNHSGENNPMFGKKHDPETILKMKKPKRKDRKIDNRLGKKLYNNGERNSYLYPDQVPEGWILGKIR